MGAVERGEMIGKEATASLPVGEDDGVHVHVHLGDETSGGDGVNSVFVANILINERLCTADVLQADYIDLKSTERFDTTRARWK